ncbi:MAG: phage tail tip lysozyme [Ilumatobacter sp.]|uniref:phage tail tip lysozyme n=1 Tax=Ilumatobacter sp. TaxID=1967498 RepID=UPI0026368898|nr:phage tail tip lysozyme [Ilumatobacter sp.]MDJ0769718.1 phage tail tip lysozyme [Ilumatobacter sp.]
MALVTWDEIGGVPVHYARDLVPSVRNRGTRRRFRSQAAFKAKLDAMFAEMWEHCGLGKASVIVTAGAFVDKAGMHGEGRAFDLDGIVWLADDERAEREFYSVDFAADAPFYWAVGGILNRHMRFVLHAAFDATHEDHFHITDKHPPGFSSTSPSAVKYLQAAITHVHGRPIAIDGDKGPRTNAALQAVLEQLDIDGPIDDPAVWAAFNLATARLGMGATTTDSASDRALDDESTPRREDVAPTGDHERPLDTETSASFRLRLRTPRMRGDKVKELQRALKAAGHDPGRVDGIFGSKTKRAVEDFQRQLGLDVDGIVGPMTSGRLDDFTLRDVPVGAPMRVLGPMSDWSAIPVRTRRIRAMQILTDRYGYPVNGAAGIVGNLEAESGVMPNRVEGSRASAPMTSANNQGTSTTWTAEQVMNRAPGQTGPKRPGAGLAQWTFPTRRAGLFEHRFEGSKLGAAILFDMDAQIDYLVDELRSSQFRTTVDEVVRAAGVTVDRASDVFLLEFERPADMGTTQQQKRREFARRVLEDFRAVEE